MATNRVEIATVKDAYQSADDVARLRAIVQTARSCRRVVEVDVVGDKIVFRANWRDGKPAPKTTAK